MSVCFLLRPLRHISIKQPLRSSILNLNAVIIVKLVISPSYFIFHSFINLNTFKLCFKCKQPTMNLPHMYLTELRRVTMVALKLRFTLHKTHFFTHWNYTSSYTRNIHFVWSCFDWLLYICVFHPDYQFYSGLFFSILSNLCGKMINIPLAFFFLNLQ